METERFEDKIKGQLQDREITPSVGSWGKLSAKLDATQEKKRPFIFWMGIAASIIGGILILSLVFNNSTPIDSPVIVNEPVEELKIKEAPIEIAEEVITQNEVEVEQIATSEDIEVEDDSASLNSNVAVLPDKQMKQRNRKELAVINNKHLLKEPTFLKNTALTNDEILDIKLNDALGNIVNQFKNEQTFTVAEANELLEEAASKISKEHYKSDFGQGKVNPQDLLQDVEFEMDNSFRDKILEILKEGYSKAKTAVANKNYL